MDPAFGVKWLVILALAGLLCLVVTVGLVVFLVLLIRKKPQSDLPAADDGPEE